MTTLFRLSTSTTPVGPHQITVTPGQLTDLVERAQRILRASRDSSTPAQGRGEVLRDKLLLLLSGEKGLVKVPAPFHRQALVELGIALSFDPNTSPSVFDIMLNVLKVTSMPNDTQTSVGVETFGLYHAINLGRFTTCFDAETSLWGVMVCIARKVIEDCGKEIENLSSDTANESRRAYYEAVIAELKSSLSRLMAYKN